ncbi:MAG TPA: hypothetical protein VNA04_18485 [Thermoanaerobaculia bacterium]|nr:hypothetical protein [Thermoanaerobaculia bacterium]
MRRTHEAVTAFTAAAAGRAHRGFRRRSCAGVRRPVLAGRDPEA